MTGIEPKPTQSAATTRVWTIVQAFALAFVALITVVEHLLSGLRKGGLRAHPSTQ
jgi:hypothetical protein